MTFEEYWAIIAKKTEETVTKEQLKYYCEIAYGQGQASSIEERPTGEWEKPFEMNGKSYHKCTNCHISSELILINKFCPNCGADMRKGGTE